MSASPFSVKQFRIFFISCWLTLMLDQGIVLFWFGLPWQDAILDSAISN